MGRQSRADSALNAIFRRRRVSRRSWLLRFLRGAESARVSDRLMRGAAVGGDEIRLRIRFGPSGAGHVRVSFAADDGRLREGLNRMAAFVARLKTPAPLPPSEEEPKEENAEAAAPKEAEERKPAFSRA